MHWSPFSARRRAIAPKALPRRFRSSIVGPEGDRARNKFQAGATPHLTGESSFAFRGDFRRLTPARHDVAATFTIAANFLSDFQTPAPLAVELQYRTRLESLKRRPVPEDTWRIGERPDCHFRTTLEISPGPMPGSPSTSGYGARQRGDSAQRPLWNTSYTNLARASASPFVQQPADTR